MLERRDLIGGEFIQDTTIIDRLTEQSKKPEFNEPIKSVENALAMCDLFFNSDTQYFQQSKKEKIVIILKQPENIDQYEIHPTRYDMHGQCCFEGGILTLSKSTPQSWSHKICRTQKEFLECLCNDFIQNDKVKKALKDIMDQKPKGIIEQNKSSFCLTMQYICNCSCFAQTH